jgi:hypothetical protein
MRREVGKKLAIVGGAIVACAVPTYIWGYACSGAGAGDWDRATSEYAILGLALAPPAGIIGIILCAVGLLSPSSNKPRGSDEVYCIRCGHELMGPGGPCRRCDDVKTRLCETCGNGTPVNRKACVYCGADLK